MTTLTGENLKIGYEGKTVVSDLSVDFPKNKVTAIIGPNGCGKSTLLKTMARLHKADSGVICLNGRSIAELPTKTIAKEMAILPQSPTVPGGLSIYDLVSYGRTPYQTGFSKMSKHDREMVDWALCVTGLSELKDREVDTLSGGQRQRAWIAMALAQETDLLLLDEPTTYLDLAHQLEILQLLEKLNEEEGRTIVMVIHDLNHAARFAHHIVAMRAGTIIQEGDAEKVISGDVLEEVFQIDALVVKDPRTNKPAVISYELISKNQQK